MSVSSKRRKRLGGVVCVLSAAAALALGAAGCGDRAKGAEGGANGRGGAAGQAGGPVAVDVVVARAGALRPELSYTGTTRPTREVALRAQAEGRLVALNADVGDRVRRGQIVARLDDDLARAALNQAQAELASRQSEVASARTQIGDAQTQVAQARLDLQQKQADAQRYAFLARERAAPAQQAEQARTAARTAEQIVRSEQQQVRNQQAVLEAAQARVNAQRAVVAQARERLGYAVLRTPVDGYVTQKLTEQGNLLQPGGEVLRIGDFRLAQVDVQVSELELPRVSLGQRVRVTLDAYGARAFDGRVGRISPQADPVTRLIPVTVVLPNENNRIGAGLLARVRFGQTAVRRIVIPETAFQKAQGGPGGGSGGAPGAGSPSGANSSGAGAAATAAGAGNAARVEEIRASTALNRSEETQETVFVLVGEGRPVPQERKGKENGRERGGGGDENQSGPQAQQARANQPPPPRLYAVAARPVRAGVRADGQAEIIDGLRPGERVVVRSARPLKPGDEVRLSILSETGENNEGSANGQPPGGQSGGPPQAGNQPAATTGTGRAR